MPVIIEGYWDCSYCGSKKISGLTRNCPSCGRPRGDDVKFYMAGENHVVEKPLNDGPDWLCPYCGGLNPSNATRCISCGSDRADSTDDYFSMHQKKEEEKPFEPYETPKEPEPRKSGLWKLILVIGLVIGALIAISVISGTIRANRVFTIQDKVWQRAVAIEAEADVRYDAWELPADAENVTTSEEIHHVNRVLDHYEERQVQRSRQVQDGYDISYNYIDNGNGTFTQQEIRTPRYKTEYYYETEQYPVYRDDPVYATRYHFTRHEWVERRVETVQGREDELPDRAVIRMESGERMGRDETAYYVRTDLGTYRTYQSIWEALETGAQYKFSVSGDVITDFQKQ